MVFKYFVEIHDDNFFIFIVYILLELIIKEILIVVHEMHMLYLRIHTHL